MIPSISMEFLVAVLFIIDAFVFLLLFLFVKRVNRMGRGRMDGEGQVSESVLDGEKNTGDETGIQAEAAVKTAAQAAQAANAANASANEVREMLGPLIVASKDAAQEFDLLIREKKQITKQLNEALDAKIISINLLLTRATALEAKLESKLGARLDVQQFSGTGPGPAFEAPANVLDQQNRIIELYNQRKDIDFIAERLSIPKGEVQLVIDLKEKFVAMEQA